MGITFSKNYYIISESEVLMNMGYKARGKAVQTMKANDVVLSARKQRFETEQQAQATLDNLPVEFRPLLEVCEAFGVGIS